MNTPDWIMTQGYMKTPPYRGLGAGRLLNRRVIAWDTETYRMPTFQYEKSTYMVRKAPRLVCVTFAGRGRFTPLPDALVALEAEAKALVQRDGVAWKAIALADDGAEVMRGLLNDPSTTLVAHNAPFDFGVLADHDNTMLASIFRAYADGRVLDTAVREKLISIADGRMSDPIASQRLRFSLADLAVSYGLADRTSQKKGPDVWRLRYHELDRVPLAQWPKPATQYAMDDAEDTLNIVICQAPYHAERCVTKGAPFTTREGGVVNEIPQVRADWALHLMSLWGLGPGDKDLYVEWGEEITDGLDFATRVAAKAGFYRANGTVDKKALQALVEEDFTARGREVPQTKQTKRSSPNWKPQTSTKSDHLLECKRCKVAIDGKVVPALRTWGENSFLNKMRTNYYGPAGMAMRGHSMVYNYNVLVATGRTSAFKPNMQNPPRRGSYRELWVPRPGKVFCAADYGQEELRTLAQVHYWKFGKSRMRDAFLEDKDPHVMFGAELLGLTYEEFMTWKKSDDPEKKARFKTIRQAGKFANFTIPGGGGLAVLEQTARTSYFVDLAVLAVSLNQYPVSLNVGDEWLGVDSVSSDNGRVSVNGKLLTVEQQREYGKWYASQLREAWFDQWPEAKPLMDEMGASLRFSDSTDFLHPVSWRWRGGVNYTNGCNSWFQGLGADVAKEALWWLCVLCYVPLEAALELAGAWDGWEEDTDLETLSKALYGCRPVLFIHDEIIVEGPEETSHLWAQAQAYVMQRAAEWWTPDVPQDVEAALMPRWYKGADPVFDEEGRLIPWQPT